MRRELIPLTGLLMAAALSAEPGAIARPRASANAARASFDPDGSVNLPVGYRQWSHFGTRYKPDGINILDGLPIRTPEILNAYVEPGAMASFVKTGKWPDGTQIVKKFSTIRVGAGCDARTHVCKTRFGDGIFQAGYNGLGMMVKDARRFPDPRATRPISASATSRRPTSPPRRRRRGRNARHATLPSPRTPTT